MVGMRRVWIVGLCAAWFLGACMSPGRQQRAELPYWYLNPPVADEQIYGVGMADMANLSTGRTAAIARARDDIARQVSVTVESSLTDYAQEAGAGRGRDVLQFVETVSRQITSVTLEGSRAEEVVVADDGTVYALVVLSTAMLREAASAEFVRNEGAAFADFKAGEAVATLDRQLAENPTRAGQ